jgi:thiol-disulfide isomerase/thioredoxin
VSPTALPERALLVACLCAEWCGTCRDYEPLFDAQSATLAGQARFAWIDIEDHDEVLGNIEVETFPTLLIARRDDDAILFYGTVTPHAQTLARLVQGATRGELHAPADARLDGLAARVRTLVESGRL